MTIVDDQLGFLLVGSWLQCALWSCELLQAIRYLRRYLAHDSRLLWSSLLLLLLCDTFATITGCYWVYRACVHDFGDLDAAVVGGWQLSATIFLQQFSAAACQSYLIYRYCRVSRDYILSSILGLMAAGLLSVTIFCVYAASHPLTMLYQGRMAAEVMFGVEAGLDILIAGALIVFLIKKVKPDHQFAQTRQMIRRIIILSIETGSATALLAIATLVTMLTTFLTSNAIYTLAMVLGRCYSLTLLFNLNMRGERGLGGHSSSGNRASPMSNIQYSNAAGNANGDFGRVSISKSGHVSVVRWNSTTGLREAHHTLEPLPRLDLDGLTTQGHHQHQPGRAIRDSAPFADVNASTAVSIDEDSEKKFVATKHILGD